MEQMVLWHANATINHGSLCERPVFIIGVYEPAIWPLRLFAFSWEGMGPGT